MSTETLNRLIKEVNSLTPQERRELIHRLTREDRTEPALPSLNTHEDAADTATLREWLRDARDVRSKLPLTSDSVEILRELRGYNERNGSLC